VREALVQWGYILVLALALIEMEAEVQCAMRMCSRGRRWVEMTEGIDVEVERETGGDGDDDLDAYLRSYRFRWR
jgi:hypothetical protein